MPKPFFIGVDGGATHCLARIRDLDGHLLGEGVGGPANIHSDFPLAKESIRGATKSALAAAGLDEQNLRWAHVGLGLAGAGQKATADRLLSELTGFALLCRRLSVILPWQWG